MNVMEIIAPFGSMRLENFPAFEDYKPPYRLEYYWKRISEKQQFDLYSKREKRIIGRQCQCIKAFMK